VAGNLLIFNFDGDMCHRQYTAPGRGKPAVSSSFDDEDD
jgi:hypothetical protein